MLELIPNQLGYPLLSLLIFLPVAGGVLLLAVRDARAARWTALLFSLAELALCIPLLTKLAGNCQACDSRASAKPGGKGQHTNSADACGFHFFASPNR